MGISKQLLSLLLPITVTILVPLAIESRRDVPMDIFIIPGFLILAGGLILLGVTISMLIRTGRGTLAPWSPTVRLVVTGIYAHTRNPMITAVNAILAGEALIVRSMNIAIWCVVFFALNTVYFIFSEEPGLEKRFGAEYLEYKRNVPRWIPRFIPWKQGGK